MVVPLLVAASSKIYCTPLANTDPSEPGSRIPRIFCTLGTDHQYPVCSLDTACSYSPKLLGSSGEIGDSSSTPLRCLVRDIYCRARSECSACLNYGSLRYPSCPSSKDSLREVESLRQLMLQADVVQAPAPASDRNSSSISLYIPNSQNNSNGNLYSSRKIDSHCNDCNSWYSRKRLPE